MTLRPPAELRDGSAVPPRDYLFILHAAAPWAQHRTLLECITMLERSTFVYVAYISGSPVGCARCITDSVARAFIEDVAVVPHARHAGIGSLLVETIEKRLSRMGVERVVLVTGVTEFWEKLGYGHAKLESHLMMKGR